MHFNLSAAKLFRETTKLEAGTCRPKTIRGRLSCYVFCICCKYQKYKAAESIKNNQGRGTFKLMRRWHKIWNCQQKRAGTCRPKTYCVDQKQSGSGSPLKLFSSIWRWRDKRIRFGNFMNWTVVLSNPIDKNTQSLSEIWGVWTKRLFSIQIILHFHKNKMHPQINLCL